MGYSSLLWCQFSTCKYTFSPQQGTSFSPYVSYPSNNTFIYFTSIIFASITLPVLLLAPDVFMKVVINLIFCVSILANPIMIDTVSYAIFHTWKKLFHYIDDDNLEKILQAKNVDMEGGDIYNLLKQIIFT